jgi:hypothetical protein
LGEPFRETSNLAKFFNGGTPTPINSAEESSFDRISDAVSESKHVQVITVKTLRRRPRPVGVMGKILAVWELDRFGFKVKYMQLRGSQ